MLLPVVYKSNLKEEAAKIVREELVGKLSKALSISQEDIEVSKTLQTYGVDSLLAVELRNYFAKDFNADIAVFDITGSASFEDVSLTVAKKSRFRQESWVEGTV